MRSLSACLLLVCSLGPSPLLRAQGSDSCASPQPIAGEGAFVFQLIGATTDGLPNAACGAPGDEQIEADVWFEWTAPTDGTAIVSTCGGSNLDTRLAAYSDVGACPPVALIACDDDSCETRSRLEFPVLAGASYLLRVGERPGSFQGGGTLSIAVTAPGTPPQDRCIGARWISGYGLFDFDTSAATTDGAPYPLCGGPGGDDQLERDLWFVWTASDWGPVVVRTCGLSAVDTRVAVYQSPLCPPLTPLGCDDDGCGAQSELGFSAQPGGRYLIRVGQRPGTTPGVGQLEVLPSLGECGALASGPDVLVGELDGVFQFGTLGGVTAYAIGTVACNVGDQPVQWVAATNEHPVIAQNLYRLEGGRFEQLGQSWLKHGIGSLNQDICCTCQDPGTNAALGVGCSDPYSSILNGEQLLLGPRWEVDPASGEFPFPFTGQGVGGDVLYKRLQVANAELDPAQHPDARYFAEAQYVTRDDALAGNAANNFAHRELLVGPLFNGGWRLSPAGPTERGEAALRAWQRAIPAVSLVELDVPGDGRLVVGSLATDNGDGTWSYEYAVANLSVGRAARAFRVPLAPGVSASALGFHDVDSHSGDPHDTGDWGAQLLAGAVEWSTATWQQDPRANSLRWGTLYNFRFVADAPPASAPATIALFEPGTPVSVSALVAAPFVCATSSYCTSAPNSQGTSATISAAGSTSVAANDLVLRVAGGVPGEPALFFYGPEELALPFGDGLRCVGGGGLGLFRLEPPVALDAQGAASRALALDQPPASAGPGAILPGSTWRFQVWYRDPAAGGAGFNLSDALRASFCR